MKNSNQILRSLLIGGLVLSTLIAKPIIRNNGTEILEINIQGTCPICYKSIGIEEKEEEK